MKQELRLSDDFGFFIVLGAFPIHIVTSTNWEKHLHVGGGGGAIRHRSLYFMEQTITHNPRGPSWLLLVNSSFRYENRNSKTGFHSIHNRLHCPLLSKNIKIKIYKTIILPAVLYGHETLSH
jgi:hypothetical protein